MALLHSWEYPVILVIVVVWRLWGELLVLGLPWAACIGALETMRVSPEGGSFQVSSSSGASGSCVWSTWCHKQQGLTFHLWEATKESFGQPWPTAQRGFLCLVLGVLSSLWLLAICLSDSLWVLFFETMWSSPFSLAFMPRDLHISLFLKLGLQV